LKSNNDCLNQDGEIDSELFLESMDKIRRSVPEAGIIWRWSLAAAEDKCSLELQLQVITSHFE